MHWIEVVHGAAADVSASRGAVLKHLSVCWLRFHLSYCLPTGHAHEIDL